MSHKQYPSINLTDIYTPLAVWGFSWAGWQLIKVERPMRAIANCNPPFVLVFPTYVKPYELEIHLKKSLNKKMFLQKFSGSDLVAVRNRK